MQYHIVLWIIISHTLYFMDKLSKNIYKISSSDKRFNFALTFDREPELDITSERW